MIGRVVQTRWFLLAVAVLALPACNLEGIGLEAWLGKTLDAFDNTPPAPDPSPEPSPEPTPGPGPSPGPGPGPAPPESRFSGTWIAAYGDEVGSASTSRGRNEYAVRMTLVQRDATVSGTGTMTRIFREGSTAQDRFSISITGTATGDDAVLRFRASRLDFEPVWYLRLADDRMIGMYFAVDLNQVVARSGQGLWHRVGNPSPEGAWVGGFSDAFPASGSLKRDRTLALVLNVEADSTLSGTGGMRLQRAGDLPLARDFNVLSGAVNGSQADFTLGGLDLADTPFDWFGYQTEGILVGAYAQFDAAAQLTQNGHAQLFASPAADPSGFDATWVCAYSDSQAADGQANDYLVLATLDVSGNTVTGSAQIRDEGQDTPLYRIYDIENGQITGSRLHVELAGSPSTFLWDLRLGDKILVGSYQQVTPGGTHISRGSGHWRRRVNSSLEGSWVAAYYDTDFTGLEGAGAPASQLAIITVSDVTPEGTVLGNGALRIAGENSRRIFTVTGTVNRSQVTWDWSGTDLFGVTSWNLLKAGDLLYGVYTNYSSAGSVEFRGHALFRRTNRVDAF